MEEKSIKLPLYLYDEKCTLCNRFKMALDRLIGSKVTAVSVYDEEIYRKFPKLNKEECFSEIHLITEEKEILKGEQAMEYLIRMAPGVSKFSWLMESDMGQKAVSYFHDMTSKYRKELKKYCPDCTKNRRHRRPQA